MRVLYHIQIMHHVSEVGGPELFGLRSGAKELRLYSELLKNYWQEVEEVLRSLIPSFRGVYIYQDSFLRMHIRFLEKNFQALVAQCKSPNFLFIKKLIDEGAILEGVEEADVDLAYRRALRMKNFSSFHKGMERALLDLRDHVIARGIAATLPMDGTGILFIGCGHRVDYHVQRNASDIQIVKPIQLPEEQLDDLLNRSRA